MENIYTSLKLSKKLSEAGCELESNKTWGITMHHGTENINLFNCRKQPDDERTKHFSGYDLIYDICIKYCKEFFGEKNIEDGFDIVDGEINMINHTTSYKYHTKEVLELLQDGKKQEAELYIWDNCLFNPKNK